MPRSALSLAVLLLVLCLLPRPLRPLSAAHHPPPTVRPPQPAPAAVVPPKLPRVAAGWRIAEIAAAPDILYPTAIACAPDGTVYLGQDPMDMPGPPTEPIDSVVAIRGRGAARKITVFADKLHAVMGLEWLDGALYVVHPPYLSRFRDTDGDGTADERVDLVTGLGPPVPAFNGINDHVASGVRLGMDGFLYVSVGDKGAPRAVGRDGRAAQLHGGGVVRVRPDGSGLEVFCTGLRNPLSPMLTAADDVFTYGNDDDSKKWPNELAHCIDGGHYGYPYQFLAAPRQCLPIVAGQVGGAGTQGVCYEEDGLPALFRGNLFVTDWGLGRLFRYEIEPNGATFRPRRPREVVAEPGPVGDFRPFAVLPTPGGDQLLLVDWAYGGWLAKGLRTGRLYELTWAGPGAPQERRPRGSDSDPLEKQLASLSHPARAERLRAQRALSRIGEQAVAPLARLLQGDGEVAARRHAVWALGAINTGAARGAIRAALSDRESEVRRQAARALGVRRDRASARALLPLLHDTDAAVRREAAIALGRIGDAATAPALLDALDESDTFVAWSLRTALRRIGHWDEKALTQALTSSRARIRDNALLAVEDVYDPAVVRVLARVARTGLGAQQRKEVVRVLAGLYRRYPPWDGNWFGTNPLAGRFPEKTQPWDGAAMARIADTLAAVLKEDSDAQVRGTAIAGVATVGRAALPDLRRQLPRESDPDNRRALALALGRLQDREATPALADLLKNAGQPGPVRQAAAEALAALNTPAALAHLRDLLKAQADDSLRAQALVALGRARALDAATLAPFLGHRSAALRVAALEALQGRGSAEPALARAVLPLLEDKDRTVQGAAIAAAGALHLRAAIPRLVALAAAEPTRSQALAALTQLPDPRAMGAYLTGLTDRNLDLRRASQRALLAVRDLVGVELERRVWEKQIPDAALPAVERVLTRFTALRDWKVVGPFARTNPPLFQTDEAIDFAAVHTGPNGIKVRWRPQRGEDGTGRVLLERFKAGAGDRGGFGYDASGSPDLNAYAYAEIDAPAARDALLLVGSSGSVTVRLNGRVVHSYNNFAGRAYAPDSDLVRVRLRQGSNRLVVHSRQGIGVWCFSVQVSDPSQALFAAGHGRPALEDLRAFALKHDGAPERGARLFLGARGLGCLKCHAVEGKGGTVGPDLAGLAAKYDRAEIISSVLEPSKRIATGYQPVLIATTRGKVLTGLVREETADHLDLMDADGKVVRVRKADIDERRVSDVSIMPVGLADTLRPEEFADLISYLLSLKQPAPPAKK
jgi:putative heme-binding domain-containing protein